MSKSLLWLLLLGSLLVAPQKGFSGFALSYSSISKKAGKMTEELEKLQVNMEEYKKQNKKRWNKKIRSVPQFSHSWKDYRVGCATTEILGRQEALGKQTALLEKGGKKGFRSGNWEPVSQNYYPPLLLALLVSSSLSLWVDWVAGRSRRPQSERVKEKQSPDNQWVEEITKRKVEEIEKSGNVTYPNLSCWKSSSKKAIYGGKNWVLKRQKINKLLAVIPQRNIKRTKKVQN